MTPSLPADSITRPPTLENAPRTVPSPPTTLPDAALSWSQTRALMRADFARLLPMMGGSSLAKRMFWFMLPSFQGIFLYRIYRHLFLRGWRDAAQLMYLFSLYKTRVDIPPRTAIGAGCLLGHPPVLLAGRIGERFTCMGLGGVGGGLHADDIGGGPGLPVIGDDVTVSVQAMVLGPVRVGDGARVGPGALVTEEVPAGSLVLWNRPRMLRRGAPANAIDTDTST